MDVFQIEALGFAIKAVGPLGICAALVAFGALLVGLMRAR
jgi:hypothetical protein